MLAPIALSVGIALAAGGTASADPAPATSTRSADPSPPNLVLITLDTTRADRLGSWGNPRTTTPHLDAFAASAVSFIRATTVSNNTLPAHVAMLTGRYPHAAGVPRNGFHLDPDVPYLSAILRDAGWETAAFVSAVALSAKLDLDRGFETFDDRLPVHEMDQTQRRADQTVDAALGWLAAPHDRPWFLWVHLFDPHYPYSPPAPWNAVFGGDYHGPADGSIEYLLGVWGRGVPRVETTAADRQHLIDLYDGEVEYLDEQLGRLLDELGRPERRRDTAVLVLADHGESLTEHDYLFDHGEYLYQPGIHVPFALRLPGREDVAPRLEMAPVQGVDVFPTFLALAGIAAPPGADGIDLLPLARGERGPRRAVSFAESCRPWSVEARQGGGYHNLTKAQTSIRGPWKLIATPYLDKIELYNLDRDPAELHDVAAAHPDVANTLAADLERWRHGKVHIARPNLDNQERLRALGYVE